MLEARSRIREKHTVHYQGTFVRFFGRRLQSWCPKIALHAALASSVCQIKILAKAI